jgi:prevent-host-death family protein
MESIISTSDLKKTPSRYLKLARNSGEPVVVTEHGRASAVLLDYEIYLGLLATIEEIRSPDGRALLEQAKREAAEGKTTPHKEIVAEFLENKAKTDGK